MWRTYHLCFIVLFIAICTACTNDKNSNKQPTVVSEELVWISEIPIIKDAYDIESEGTTAQYKTLVPLGTFITFYDESLADSGWERGNTRIVDNPSLETSGPLELFYTHSDGRILTITVVSDEKDRFLLNVTMEQGGN